MLDRMKLRAEQKQISKIRKELYKKPQLATLFFELTDACNMACLHCGSRACPENNRYIAPVTVKKVLGEVKDAYGTDGILICFTGGEPLLHPDFYELVRYATDMGFGCGITTNGVLIDGQTAGKLKRCGVRSVSVSVDGLAESHDWFRGRKGAYERAVRGVTELVRVGGIYTQVTTVVHKKNIDELEAVLAAVRETGAHSFRPVCIDPIGRALTHDELMLSGDEHKRLLDFIEEKRRRGDEGIDVTYGCSHYLGDKYEGKLRDHVFFCGAGLTVAGILCNGDIFACLDIARHERLIQGNAEKDNFVSVWENGFKEFRRDKSELCKKCSECKERKFCAGDSGHTWDYENNEPLLCMKEKLDGGKSR
jgi:radical SAM protein with 4Fe4S-binding SPASM domain